MENPAIKGPFNHFFHGAISTNKAYPSETDGSGKVILLQIPDDARDLVKGSIALFQGLQLLWKKKIDPPSVVESMEKLTQDFLELVTFVIGNAYEDGKINEDDIGVLFQAAHSISDQDISGTTFMQRATKNINNLKKEINRLVQLINELITEIEATQVTLASYGEEIQGLVSRGDVQDARHSKDIQLLKDKSNKLYRVMSQQLRDVGKKSVEIGVLGEEIHVNTGILMNERSGVMKRRRKEISSASGKFFKTQFVKTSASGTFVSSPARILMKMMRDEYLKKQGTEAPVDHVFTQGSPGYIPFWIGQEGAVNWMWNESIAELSDEGRIQVPGSRWPFSREIEDIQNWLWVNRKARELGI